MPEYKCINCGEIKESEKLCTCPICGYSMYEQPYERAEMLRSEIIRFIECIIREKAHITDVCFKEKNEDEKRFPDFDKIRQYVCSSQKTEIFLDRLLNSTEQIKKHIREPFRKKYTGDPDKLSVKSERSKEQLLAVAEELETEIDIGELACPDITLEYSEIPDDILLSDADKLLDRIVLLADKIKEFIKKNGIYGTAYQKTIGKPSLSEEKDRRSDIKKCIGEANVVLAKKYVVDILEDGTKELNEMLKAVWDSVFVIMSAPVLQKEHIYTVGEKTGLDESEYLAVLSEILADRFSAVNEYIRGEDFLNNKTEDRLFDLYNKILDLDWYGYMKVNKGTVLKTGESEKALEMLIGLSSVKTGIMKIKAYAAANKDSSDLNLHMCFYGNPGTGKTEAARIIAGILHENGLLPTDNVVETDRSGLVAGYVGQTALKTADKIAEAMGGVLFIDEAYSLIQSETKGDYGHEAVATLIKAMEDHRGKLCVIFAGYKNPMQEMLAANPGFESRIQFRLDFPNYSRDELGQIAKLMLKKKKYSIGEAALSRILDITDIKRKDPNFANAREIRNILDQVIMCQNLRCAGTDDKSLEIIDVNNYIKDNNISLPTDGEGIVKKILSAEEELDRLVGL